MKASRDDLLNDIEETMKKLDGPAVSFDRMSLNDLNKFSVWLDETQRKLMEAKS